MNTKGLKMTSKETERFKTEHKKYSLGGIYEMEIHNGMCFLSENSLEMMIKGTNKKLEQLKQSNYYNSNYEESTGEIE